MRTCDAGAAQSLSSTTRNVSCNTFALPRPIGGVHSKCSQQRSRMDAHRSRRSLQRRRARRRARSGWSWSRRGSTPSSPIVCWTAHCLGGACRSSTSIPRRSRARRYDRSRSFCDCRRRAFRSLSCAQATTCARASQIGRSRRQRMVRTAALSLLAATVIAADWLRLERGPHTSGRLVVLVLLAVTPALGRRRLRWFGLIVAMVAALAVAFSLSPRMLWPDGSDFFGTFASRFGGGFEDFYQYRLPIEPAFHARMHMLLLLAVFGFCALTAIAIASRRAVAAVCCFVVAAGWPATLLGGGSPLVRGAVILVVALALLAGLTDRAGAFAVPAVRFPGGCAVAVASSPAPPKSA